MSKFNPIPRLSILVPIGRDLAAFERTLISVLENRPTNCEVLVAHDGSYDDPFDLCDEVRFVVGASNRLVDLVAAGAGEASAKFVHVLADGVIATTGWAEEALESFEDGFDIAVVSPVIRSNLTGKVVAAGWCDAGDRLCKNASQGKQQVDDGVSVAAFLQASFWRREVLQSLTLAYNGTDDVEASYAYQHLIHDAGWRCALAVDSDVQVVSGQLPWDASTVRRGQQLRAIRNFFEGAGWQASFAAAARACLSNLIRPSHLAESLGQAIAPLGQRHVARQMRLQEVAECDVEPLQIPDATQHRRAA